MDRQCAFLQGTYTPTFTKHTRFGLPDNCMFLNHGQLLDYHPCLPKRRPCFAFLSLFAHARVRLCVHFPFSSGSFNEPYSGLATVGYSLPRLERAKWAVPSKSSLRWLYPSGRDRLPPHVTGQSLTASLTKYCSVRKRATHRPGPATLTASARTGNPREPARQDQPLPRPKVRPLHWEDLS